MWQKHFGKTNAWMNLARSVSRVCVDEFNSIKPNDTMHCRSADDWCKSHLIEDSWTKDVALYMECGEQGCKLMVITIPECCSCMLNIVGKWLHKFNNPMQTPRTMACKERCLIVSANYHDFLSVWESIDRDWGSQRGGLRERERTRGANWCTADEFMN